MAWHSQILGHWWLFFSKCSLIRNHWSHLWSLFQKLCLEYSQSGDIENSSYFLDQWLLDMMFSLWFQQELSLLWTDHIPFRLFDLLKFWERENVCTGMRPLSGVWWWHVGHTEGVSGALIIIMMHSANRDPYVGHGRGIVGWAILVHHELGSWVVIFHDFLYHSLSKKAWPPF